MRAQQTSPHRLTAFDRARAGRRTATPHFDLISSVGKPPAPARYVITGAFAPSVVFRDGLRLPTDAEGARGRQSVRLMSAPAESSAAPHVVIAGGGFAAIEALLAL